MSLGAYKARTGTAFPWLWDDEGPSREAVTTVVAVDPGTVHCGVAIAGWEAGGWRVLELADERPAACLIRVRSWLEMLEVNRGDAGMLVIEEFKLYPSKMQQQGFSNMGPAEVVGALRWVATDARVRIPTMRLGLVMQGASVVKAPEGREAPAIRWMREHGVKVMGSNPHKRDAEAHLWWRIGRLGGKPV